MILREIQYAVMDYGDHRALCLAIVRKARRQPYETVCTISKTRH